MFFIAWDASMYYLYIVRTCGYKYIKSLNANILVCKILQCCVRKNGILSPKLFWPSVRKNCSSDREKPLTFEAEGQQFAKILRSL